MRQGQRPRQKYGEEYGRWLRKKKSDNWDRSYHRVRPDERSRYCSPDCQERFWPWRPTVLSLSKHRARSAHCYSTITLPATDTQYKFSPWSELNMEPEQLQIIMMLQVEVMLTMVVSYRSRARQKYDKEEE